MTDQKPMTLSDVAARVKEVRGQIEEAGLCRWGYTPEVLWHMADWLCSCGFVNRAIRSRCRNNACLGRRPF